MNKRKNIFFSSLVVFMLFSFAGCGSHASGSRIVRGGELPGTSAVSTETEEVTEEEEKTDNMQQADEELYMVISMLTNGSVLRVFDIEKGRQEDYTYNDATYFLDKYGNYISASQMQPGRIVCLETSRKTGELSTVQISDEAWEYDGVKRFSIQEDQKIFTIADTKYYYKDDLHIFSEEDMVKLSDISENDILRVQGIGKQILTISITTGHGLIQLANTELFEGGWLSLSAKTYLKVTKDMQIEAQEGTYLLSVANDGYGDTKEITVKRGETTVVDLDELKGEGPKFCTVTFEVGVENAVMTLDGQIIDYTQPQQIRYGIHRLEIVAEGYETWSKRLYVNSEEATIQVAMTSDGTAGKTEDNTEESSETKDSKDKDTEDSGDKKDSKDTKSTEQTESGKAGSQAGSQAGSLAGSKAGSKKNSANKSTESSNTEKSTEKDSEKSTEKTTSKSTQDYLKTLSDIIDTLTGSSSGSN